MNMQFYVTPDGGMFFNNEDEMLRYVASKCGNDVANYFRSYDDIVQVLYDFSPCDLEEFIEEFNIDKTAGMNPILELKKLREMKKKFEDLLFAYRQMYDKV